MVELSFTFLSAMAIANKLTCKKLHNTVASCIDISVNKVGFGLLNPI